MMYVSSLPSSRLSFLGKSKIKPDVTPEYLAGLYKKDIAHTAKSLGYGLITGINTGLFALSGDSRLVAALTFFFGLGSLKNWGQHLYVGRQVRHAEKQLFQPPKDSVKDSKDSEDV